MEAVSKIPLFSSPQTNWLVLVKGVKEHLAGHSKQNLPRPPFHQQLGGYLNLAPA
jgi:hypothetical protein